MENKNVEERMQNENEDKLELIALYDSLTKEKKVKFMSFIRALRESFENQKTIE